MADIMPMDILFSLKYKRRHIPTEQRLFSPQSGPLQNHIEGCCGIEDCTVDNL